MTPNDLSAHLWRERELLELLLFKLEEEQLLLTAGRTRWLPHATREVEQVMERLREAGLQRTIAISAIAGHWHTSPEATLRELVQGAPDAIWNEILGSHLKAMTELTGQIKTVRDHNERFLRQATRSTQETLAGLDSESATYGANGGLSTESVGSRLVERNL